MTSITFFQSHLAFNIFIPEHNGFQRKRNGDALMDICNIHRYSLFLVLLFFFFFIPFSLKLPFCPLCHAKLKIPSFVTERLCWRMLRGQKAPPFPLRQTPMSSPKINFLKEWEELPLVMVLVSEACFRAATCTGPYETRQLNILPLIKPPCWGVKIGGGCQRFSYRAGNAGAGRVSFCLKPMNLLQYVIFFHFRSYPWT